jgi:hypothetical protein
MDHLFVFRYYGKIRRTRETIFSILTKTCAMSWQIFQSPTNFVPHAVEISSRCGHRMTSCSRTCFQVFMRWVFRFRSSDLLLPAVSEVRTNVSTLNLVTAFFFKMLLSISKATRCHNTEYCFLRTKHFLFCAENITVCVLSYLRRGCLYRTSQ